MITGETVQMRVLVWHISLLHHPVVILHSGPIAHVNHGDAQQKLQEQRNAESVKLSASWNVQSGLYTYCK